MDQTITQTDTVLMSGGIDSTACAHFLIAKGIAVTGVFLDYCQPAALAESHAVSALAEVMKIPLTHCTLTGNSNVPVGEIVGRNAFLIFSALLISKGSSGLIATGIHSGSTYFDCSEFFIEQISSLVVAHTDGKTQLVTPFIQWNKAQVYDYFRSAGLPLNLTYSCELGSIPSCGNCASCRDRGELKC